MTTSRLISTAAAVASAAVVAAGCGGGSGGSEGAGADDRAKLEQAQLKFAECMRRNGVDIPDPKPGGGGAVMIAPGPSGGSPATAATAEKKCRHFLKDVPPPKLSEEKTEMRDAALAHARCMRKHGIDFPDPTFGPDGSMRVELGEGGRGPRPEDPRFQAAQKACEKEMPGGFGGPDNPVPAG